MEFTRLNPLTGEVASSALAMKAGDIPAIAARAAAAFPAWAAQGPNARRAVLMKAADSLEARKDKFVAAMMGEIGVQARVLQPGLHFLPPFIYKVTKAIVEGRYEMPKGTALRSPQGQQILSDVAQYAPGFDATEWQNRANIRKEFTSGKTAQNIKSLNTMIQHVGTMVDAAKELGNGRFSPVNAATNKALEMNLAGEAILA